MVNVSGTRPSPITVHTAIRPWWSLSLAAILAITLASCSSGSPQEDNTGSGAGPADQFELIDRAGKTYVLTDLYSCAPTDNTTGDQRCDYQQFYLLSGGVHYRFGWYGIRSIERQSQSPGDVFKLTLEGGQSMVGTFDQPPSDAKGRPAGPANALSASLVEMGGNTAVFPVSVIVSLRRRSTQK
jgi:hypothetical protein